MFGWWRARRERRAAEDAARWAAMEAAWDARVATDASAAVEQGWWSLVDKAWPYLDGDPYGQVVSDNVPAAIMAGWVARPLPDGAYCKKYTVQGERGPVYGTLLVLGLHVDPPVPARAGPDRFARDGEVVVLSDGDGRVVGLTPVDRERREDDAVAATRLVAALDEARHGE